MQDIKDKIKALVDQLQQELTDLSQHEEYDHIKPKPHPPASTIEIKRLEKHIGRSLPNSYRVFLELYNGYDWLAYPGHMLSVKDLMPGSKSYQEIQSWKKTSAKYGSGEVLDGIVIGNLGQGNSWVYLDPNNPSEPDELMVIEWDPEGSEEYPTLVEFLEECMETCRSAFDKDVD